MFTSLRRGLQRTWRKNELELRALATGRMPAWIFGGELGPRPPVFVFHDVSPEGFERQLRHLASNGYRTLGAAELEEALRDGAPTPRSVVLTFDDATWTFWSYALPLLRRFGMRAILFAVPGLVPDAPGCRPTLDDLDAGTESQAQLVSLGNAEPLCRWDELTAIQASGLVDIQSHSLTHARVPIAPQVADVMDTTYETGRFANTDVPLSVLDDPLRPDRAARAGAIVLRSASRLAGRPRYFEPNELHAEAASSTERRALLRHAAGRYETAAEAAEAMRVELAASKAMLEARLPGLTVSQFCFPWFVGCPEADRLALEAGYRVVHYGPDHRMRAGMVTPLRVARVPEDFLCCLPGDGRERATAVWRQRLRGRTQRASAAAEQTHDRPDGAHH